MSDLFPYLAVPAADHRYTDHPKVHAMTTALNYGWARTACGLEPIDPREPGMPMDEQRALPRFADVPDPKKCGQCIARIHDMEAADNR